MHLSYLFDEETDNPHEKEQLDGIPRRTAYANEVIIAEKTQKDNVCYLQEKKTKSPMSRNPQIYL